MEAARMEALRWTGAAGPGNDRRMNAPLRDLFSPVRIGPYELPNRIVMAPMTRNRAGAGEVPTALMATYYAQRASAGLIVSEGTQIVPQGQGYPGTPGIHSAAQIAGWKRVTDAVHDRGGRIFCQLWHVGRISHPLLQPGGALPVAPSALVPAGQLWTQQGMQSYVVPRALEAAEIPGLVADYRAAAVNARQAGFDGVELHAANGYLIDQFLRDSTNRRTDRYGGSIANRARLLLEIAGALVDELGAALVGVRVSPTNPFNDIVDSDPAALFGHVAAALDRLDLAYLHVVEPGDADPAGPGARPDGRFFRVRWRGPLMLNKGYDRKRGDATVAEGVADLVSFATSFLANPDLPERLRRGGPFNPPDRPTFYGGGERGYTDYPALS
jgi:N-ethylmaleimide reductase